MGVGTRRVDDEELTVGERSKCPPQAIVVIRLATLHTIVLGILQRQEFRHRQVVGGESLCHTPLGAIFQIPRQAFLAHVDVEHAYGPASAQKRNDEVHGHGGLTGPALFISDHNHMRVAFSGHRP